MVTKKTTQSANVHAPTTDINHILFGMAITHILIEWMKPSQTSRNGESGFEFKG